MGVQRKKKKHLSIWLIWMDTNTDDKTIKEFLEENNAPDYKFPYSDDFVTKYILNCPTKSGDTKK